mgnify:FL=1
MQKAKCYFVTLPRKFAEDHTERSLPTGALIEANGNTIKYCCTVDELYEWRSDAWYYSDCGSAKAGWSDPDPALQVSARKTWAKVQAVIDTIV